jgi:hypothetical protein
LFSFSLSSLFVVYPRARAVGPHKNIEGGGGGCGHGLNVSQRVLTCSNRSNGFQQVPMGLLKLVGVCVEDSFMYLLYYGVVLYHASQLSVSYIA